MTYLLGQSLMAVALGTSQQTKNICITFVQCWTNVEDVGPTLYKCYKMFCVCWDTPRFLMIQLCADAFCCFVYISIYKVFFSLQIPLAMSFRRMI